MAFVWTEDRIAKTRKLWIEGKSATEIAEVLGGGLSRSAVIGKVHRLGLTRDSRAHPPVARVTAARPPRPVRTPKPPKPERKAVIRSASPSPVIVGIDYKLTPATEEQKAACRKAGLSMVERVETGAGVDSPNARPFLEAKRGCKWPLAGEMVCCSPIARGVYCEGHAAVAYIGVGRDVTGAKLTARSVIERNAFFYTRDERQDSYRRVSPANDDRPSGSPWDSGRFAA